MGDLTSARLTAIASMPQQVEKILEALPEEPEDTTVNGFIVECSYLKISCGSAEEIHVELSNLEEQIGPFAYRVYEDPKYEWLGQTHIHVPGMDDFNAECEEGGGVVLRRSDLDKVIRDASTREELIAGIDKAFGKDIIDKFNHLRELVKPKQKEQ